jgi:hypothetical protein
MIANPAYCVCAPARNEAVRLPVLIDALASQDVSGVVPVAIFVNNSDDGSADVARQAAARWGERLKLRVVEADFAPALAHAGSARRAAMNLGLEVVGHRDEALLISTDADARPPNQWISANLAAAAQADLVGGALRLDESEPIAADLLGLRRQWDLYWSMVREIEDEIDPCPWDPAPRHGDHTGASLAITVAAYRAAGGSPVIPSGEDRALVAFAQATGARLVHPVSVWTRVSGRLDGRAAGGMAEEMARLSLQAGGRAPVLAPNLDHWRARARWRADLRRRPDGAALIAQHEPSLAAMPHDAELSDLCTARSRRPDVAA